MSMISVIVPVYNVEAYLVRCVDSILSQTFSDFELILVDDGSEDKSGSLCNEYAQRDKRVKVIHKSNGGVSDARNAGINIATGEYFTFVDGDDTVCQDFLEQIIRCAHEYNADIVLTNYAIIDSDGNITKQSSYRIPSQEVVNIMLYPELLLASPASACFKLYNRNLFINPQIRFPKGIRWAEDLLFNQKILLHANSVYYLNNENAYYYYWNRNSSVTNCKNSEIFYFDLITIVNDIKLYYESQNKWNNYRNELEAVMVLHVFFYGSRLLIGSGDKGRYLKEIHKYMLNVFPAFKENAYLKLYFSRAERVVFKLLCHKQYNVIRLVSLIKRRHKLNTRKD